MPYDMNPRNPGNERHIPEIMQDMDDILLWYKCFNDKAMKACHTNGYNGFKRLHRWNAKKFYKLHVKLENEAYDKFRFMLQDSKMEDVPYTWGSSIVEHLKRWDAMLDQQIDKLAMLNNEYRMCAGMASRIAEKALCKMTRNHEKTGRWMKRFEETKTPHDWHEVDDELHKKIKAKEEKHKAYKK